MATFRKEIKDGQHTGRYFLNFSYKGKQYRKTVTCPPSMIEKVNKKFQKSVIEKVENPNVDRKLFETLDEFLVYSEKAKSANRFKTYQFMVALFKEFFGNMILKDFKSYMVDEYRVWRKTKPLTKQTQIVSDNTINRDIAVLHHFFEYCIDREYFISRNPVRGKKIREKDRKVLVTTDQIKEIIETSKGHLHIAIVLATFSGLRIGEILKLKWEHIVFDNNPRIILPGDITKTKTDRIALMPDILTKFLLKIKKLSTCKYVVNYKGKPIKKIRRAWDTFRKTLSCKVLPNGTPIRMHDLRHIFAQSLKESGGSDSDIASACGHTDPSVTIKYYANLPNKNLNRLINQLSNKYNFDL